MLIYSLVRVWKGFNYLELRLAICSKMILICQMIFIMKSLVKCAQVIILYEQRTDYITLVHIKSVTQVWNYLVTVICLHKTIHARLKIFVQSNKIWRTLTSQSLHSYCSEDKCPVLSLLLCLMTYLQSCLFI